MFWLYCLPGRLLSYLDWLFPEGSGTAAGTHRRRDSKFAHFIRSTLFYAFVAFVIFAWQNGRDQRRHSDEGGGYQLESEEPPHRQDEMPSVDSASTQEDVVEQNAVPHDVEEERQAAPSEAVISNDAAPGEPHSTLPENASSE